GWRREGGEGSGEIRLPEEFALVIEVAVPEIDSFRLGILAEVLNIFFHGLVSPSNLSSATERARERASHGKAIGGELTGRLDELGPGKFPRTILLEREFHSADGAGNTRSSIPFNRSAFTGDNLAIPVEINISISRRGSHLAIVNRRGPPVFQPNHHEAATAQVARDGMGNREREGH